jgi:hypothetical protein
MGRRTDPIACQVLSSMVPRVQVTGVGEAGCVIDEISSLFEPTNAGTRVSNTVANGHS